MVICPACDQEEYYCTCGPEPGRIILLPSREEMLAADLPIERRFGNVIFRYKTEEDANNHLKEEARVLGNLCPIEHELGRKK